LLVVVTIIAILACLLFPTLTMAKRKAIQAVCASNMRQVGQAFQAYASDWNYSLPPSVAPIFGNSAMWKACPGRNCSSKRVTCSGIMA